MFFSRSKSSQKANKVSEVQTEKGGGTLGDDLNRARNRRRSFCTSNINRRFESDMESPKQISMNARTAFLQRAQNKRRSNGPTPQLSITVETGQKDSTSTYLKATARTSSSARSSIYFTDEKDTSASLTRASTKTSSSARNSIYSSELISQDSIDFSTDRESRKNTLGKNKIHQPEINNSLDQELTHLDASFFDQSAMNLQRQSNQNNNNLSSSHKIMSNKSSRQSTRLSLISETTHTHQPEPRVSNTNNQNKNDTSIIYDVNRKYSLDSNSSNPRVSKISSEVRHSTPYRPSVMDTPDIAQQRFEAHKRLFKKFDKNGDGELDMCEITRCLGYAKKAEDTLFVADEDDNMSIGLEEFSALRIVLF